MEPREAADICNLIDKYGRGLTMWEMDFVDRIRNIANRVLIGSMEYTLSEKEVDKLNQIYEERV